MHNRSFQQVDVFTDTPCLGNPVAVVLDGAGLTDPDMQGFTAWTNLSEATFVLPPTHPDADYRVRIFCPFGELPFAGHPTLGTCHAWLAAGGQPKGQTVVQECGVGLVRIQQTGQQLAFAAPPLMRTGPLSPELVNTIAAGLGVPVTDIRHHAWCDNGPGWCAVMLPSAQHVLDLKPSGAILGDLKLGVIGPHAPGCAAHFEVRAFFPGAQGLTEDPVTGSLNAALALCLIDAGLAPTSYVASQGTVLGRAGRVHIHRDAQGVTWVGGRSQTVIQGQVWL